MPDIAYIGQPLALARAVIESIASEPPRTELIVAASERTVVVAPSSTLIVKLLSNPFGKSFAHFARMRSSSALLERAMTERSFCAGSSLSAAIRAAKGRQGCRRDPRRGIPPRGWAVFS